MIKRIVLLSLLSVAFGVAVWAALRFTAPRLPYASQPENLSKLTNPVPYTWAEALEKVKADRSAEAAASLVIPPELQHYSDRHWFLATQVAEVAKYNVHTCQDYVDLAAMIERGEMVPVPAVTDTYVLFGVGARADDRVFTRYEDDHNIELYSEAELANAYRELDDKRSKLRTEIASLTAQSARLNKRDRAKQSELQKQIVAQQQQLKAADEDKALLDQSYGQSDSRAQLFRDFQSLQALAKNFTGRSYNLDDPTDRQVMKISMLRSLRPEALKILEQVASAYHRQFDRPLPVSSLVRPEEYQHTLRRFNRAAVLIETPPHSTGLAFDIDYRYMSAAEQNFLMVELARLKNEGRIEVLRERGANYHVFAFINGVRPNDELITASLEKASTPVPQLNHPAGKKAVSGKHKAVGRKQKAKGRRR